MWQHFALNYSIPTESVVLCFKLQHRQLTRNCLLSLNKFICYCSSFYFSRSAFVKVLLGLFFEVIKFWNFSSMWFVGLWFWAKALAILYDYFYLSILIFSHKVRSDSDFRILMELLYLKYWWCWYLLAEFKNSFLIALKCLGTLWLKTLRRSLVSWVCHQLAHFTRTVSSDGFIYLKIYLSIIIHFFQWELIPMLLYFFLKVCF